MKFIELRLIFLLITYLPIYLNFREELRKIGEVNAKKIFHCDDSKICSVDINSFPINIQLTWGDKFKELDLYVRGKNGQSVFNKKISNFDGKMKFLNNTSKQDKKEIITIQKMNSGKYLVFVNNFSKEGHIGTSKANVKIIENNELLNFTVPKSDHNPSNLNWIIGLIEFDEKKSIFKIVNKFSTFEMLDYYFDLPYSIQSDDFCEDETNLPTTPSNSKKNPQNIASIPGTGVLRPVRIASVVPSVPRTIDSIVRIVHKKSGLCLAGERGNNPEPNN